MADRSRLLTKALEAAGLSQADFEQGRIFRPNVADEIHRRLEKRRWCVLVGPPRSGKTTLAHLVGWEIRGGKRTAFSNVRCLDLTEVDDAREDITHLPGLSRSWLLIIDNWHARPDCHDGLLRRIQSEWKGIGVLFVVTRFPAEDDAPDTSLPHMEPASEEDDSPVDTRPLLLKVSRAMIDMHVESHVEGPPRYSGAQDSMRQPVPAHLRLDEEDYEQALTAPSEHKKVRVNLRFLSWCLRAWNPSKCRLRDVTFEDVLNAVERHILTPSKKWIGTLEKVAVVSQWELPYRRRAGENAPAGIEQLERLNLIVAVELGAAWRMDSTDAYLLILGTSRDDGWLNRTLALLEGHLESQPEGAPRIIGNVLSQATSDTRTTLVTALLGAPAVLERQTASLVEGLSTGQLSFESVANLINCILRDLPPVQDQARKRLEIAAALLPKRAGLAAGAGAREIPLQRTMWFLGHLAKDKERFQEFVVAFLEGYGEDSLLANIRTAPSGTVQREFLRRVGQFDPALRKRLRPQIQFRHRPAETKSFSETLSWLAHGSVEWGPARSAKIEFLMEVDEEYLLERLVKKSRAPRWIQSLLSSAQWLSPDDGARLAATISTIWSDLELPPAEPSELSIVMFNCWSANRDAAQDLVDLLVRTPLSVVVPPDKAAGLAGLLAMTEKVAPGVVQRWCRGQEEYLSQLVLSLGEETLDELLVSLAVFAHETAAQVLEGCTEEVRERLLSGSPSHGSWPRCGWLALAGGPWRDVLRGDVPDERELGSSKATDIVSTIYAIQQILSIDAALHLLQRLANVADVSPTIPLALGRHPIPWTAGNVVSIAKRILRGGIDPRTAALDRLVLAATISPSIEWSVDQRFDPGKQGHRALGTALHEDILRIMHTDGSEAMRAVLNDDDAFVRSARERIERILAPVRSGPLGLTEWDVQLSGMASLSSVEMDHWRINFLRSGIVDWSINTRVDPPEVQYSFVGEPGTELSYALVDLRPLSP